MVIVMSEGVRWCFFFFKQKTAYEMLRSLVGSEMCIRDRLGMLRPDSGTVRMLGGDPWRDAVALHGRLAYVPCLLYTSDAADDLLCVDLGGRRIIKKKKPTYTYSYHSLIYIIEHSRSYTHLRCSAPSNSQRVCTAV